MLPRGEAGQLAVPQSAEPRAERADPDRSVGVELEGHHRVGQSLALAERRELPVLEPAEAGVGADDHRAVARLDHPAAEGVAGEAVLDAEGVYLPVGRDAIEAADVAARPEGARAVLVQDAHRPGVQLRRPDEPLEAPPVRAHAEEALVGSRPDRAVPPLERREEDFARQAVAHVVRRHDAALDLVQPAAVGRNPQRAAPPLVRAADEVVGEPFGRGEGREAAVPHAVQSVRVGADPEVPLGVLEQRADEVVHAAVRGVERGEAAAGEAGEPAAVRADPDVPVAVHLDRLHVLERQAVGEAPVAERPAVEEREPALRADPHPAVEAEVQRVDVVVGQAVGDEVVLEVPAVHHREAAVRADEDPPLRVFAEGVDPLVGEAVLRRVADERLVVEAGQPLVGADPDRAVAALEEDVDAAPRRSFPRRVVREDAVVETDQAAAVEPQPEPAVARGAHRAEEVARQLGVAAAVEDREADAVVADEPFLRREPDEAVLGLGDGEGEVLGQPLLGGPLVHDQLGRRLGRAEGRRWTHGAERRHSGAEK